MWGFARTVIASYDRCMRRALLLILLSSGMAAADTKAPRKAPPPDRVEVTHREGEYGGVQPGQAPKDAPRRWRRRPSPGTLTWIGFEAKDGGAQLFFQSVGAFEVSQRVEGNTLVIHLSLRRLGRNTWRQIDTRFFDTPLAYVKAQQVGAVRTTKKRQGHKAGIDVRITFKNPQDTREGTVRPATKDADGMFYAYVSFPEGTSASLKGDSSMSDPEQ